MDINLMMSVFLFRVSLSPEIKRSWIQTNEEERGGGREGGGRGREGEPKVVELCALGFTHPRCRGLYLIWVERMRL